jgi:hypothetical protein
MAALVGMRKQFFVLFLLLSPPAFAQTNEVGLTLGGLFPQDAGTVPNTVHLSGGTSYQANYGHRLLGGRTSLFGEIHFLANPQRLVASANTAATRDVATIYITPGVRVKFATGRRLSPYVAIGGGVAFYEQSFFRIDGRSNQAPRELRTGAFDFGGGIDVKFWRWIGLRAEARDFYTGRPAYNISGLPGGQHNPVAGGGFVLKWGE